MSKKAPGLEKYTPTRLEWLANMLNTLFPYNHLREQDSDLFYMASRDGKSIIVIFRYSPRLPKEIIDEVTDHAKKTVMRLARLYDWDSWVEVVDDVAVKE